MRQSNMLNLLILQLLFVEFLPVMLLPFVLPIFLDPFCFSGTVHHSNHFRPANIPKTPSSHNESADRGTPVDSAYDAEQLQKQQLNNQPSTFRGNIDGRGWIDCEAPPDRTIQLIVS